MIRLSNIYSFKPKQRIFYFHTMEDCNEFLNVFKENNCNVKWSDPVEIPDTVKLTNSQRSSIDKSPIDRANTALEWGFEVSDKRSFFTG